MKLSHEELLECMFGPDDPVPPADIMSRLELFARAANDLEWTARSARSFAEKLDLALAGEVDLRFFLWFLLTMFATRSQPSHEELSDILLELELDLN